LHTCVSLQFNLFFGNVFPLQCEINCQGISEQNLCHCAIVLTNLNKTNKNKESPLDFNQM
jgi:hypothetical protein